MAFGPKDCGAIGAYRALSSRSLDGASDVFPPVESQTCGRPMPETAVFLARCAAVAQIMSVATSGAASMRNTDPIAGTPDSIDFWQRRDEAAGERKNLRLGMGIAAGSSIAFWCLVGWVLWCALA